MTFRFNPGCDCCCDSSTSCCGNLSTLTMPSSLFVESCVFVVCPVVPSFPSQTSCGSLPSCNPGIFPASQSGDRYFLFAYDYQDDFDFVLSRHDDGDGKFGNAIVRKSDLKIRRIDFNYNGNRIVYDLNVSGVLVKNECISDCSSCASLYDPRFAYTPKMLEKDTVISWSVVASVNGSCVDGSCAQSCSKSGTFKFDNNGVIYDSTGDTNSVLTSATVYDKYAVIGVRGSFSTGCSSASIATGFSSFVGLAVSGARASISTQSTAGCVGGASTSWNPYNTGSRHPLTGGAFTDADCSVSSGGCLTGGGDPGNGTITFSID